MHYIYGICTHCDRSTYRSPTNSYYQHMDGTRSDSDCELSKVEYI